MRFRIYFLLVTVFFVTMNVLLWRSEFGTRGHLGTPVPADLVWEKVLTSPDNSFLEIRHHGVLLGRAHWSASIGEELATGMLMDDMPPEGMVKKPISYSLDFDGNVTIDTVSRLRFYCNLKLDSNQNWQDLSIKLSVKPFSWEIRSSAQARNVQILIDDDETRNEHTFSFDDLQNPSKIARDLGGPALLAALAAVGLPLPSAKPTSTSIGLKWEARNDRIKIANNLVRVYRLEARLFDRYKATLFVSPVGEILRLELPDEIVLTNDALMNL